MTTSKGTIQGYNGVAAVDKKHQVIVDAQAFGEVQEHHTLKPVLTSIEARYRKVGLHDDILSSEVMVTADTGFSNEANNEYLHEENINAYIPDNQFRSRDKAFEEQKQKHGKRNQQKRIGVKSVIPASEFQFNKKTKSYRCPMGKELMLINEVNEGKGKKKLYFMGRLTDCRSCPIKDKCMRNPDSPNTREGSGRQVSITWTNGKTPTDWMKRRVDTTYGKSVYSHRMSAVEPVFANIGTNKGLNRFSLRGKKKVQGQWQLYCLVHNIEKIWNYGTITWT